MYDFEDSAEKLFKEELKDLDSCFIFSGGFDGGFLEIGSVIAFEKMNIDIRCYSNLCGVSVGSIVAFFLALGFTSQKIVDISDEIFDMFRLSLGSLNFDFIINLISNKSLIDSTKFRKKFISVLRNHSYYDFDSFTFEDLYSARKSNLTIVSTDNNGNPKYFNRKTARKTNVIDAVLSSICIPFIFPFTNINNKIYYDGCFSDPCPIHLFPHCNNIFYFRILSDIKIDVSKSTLEFLKPFSQMCTNLEKSKLQKHVLECRKKGRKLFIIKLVHKPNGFFTNIDRDVQIKIIKSGEEQTNNILEKIIQ